MAILGAHSYIDDSIELLFQEDADFIIGKFCSIAKGCRIILGGNHRGDWISTYPFPAMFHGSPNIPGHRTTKGPVVIGNDVWIGAGVTIVSGVTVGDGAIIGAGSVVVKDVEPYSVVCGNPGQRKKYRFPKQETERLLVLKWWDWSEDKIREAIPILMSDDIQQLFKFAEEHNNMLSVVIPIFNNHDYSYECIMAVMENTKDFELVIIDNGSEPPFKPPFTGFVECQLIRNETNTGFPHAINQGISAAKGDVICLLNNDVICTPDYAERLTGYLDEYAIVGPCANYSAGLQRVTAGIYNSKEELYTEAEAWTDDWDGMLEDVTFVIGFCMVFKKSLFDEIGSFDESLWPCSGEEIDFCLRAHEAGNRIGIARDVYVHHEGSMTLDEMDKKGVIEYQKLCKRNDAHLATKWGDDFWMKQAVAQ